MGRYALDDGVVKKCADCGLTKPLSEFYTFSRLLRSGARKYFPHSYCKLCHVDRNRTNYQSNLESRLAYQRKLTQEWKARAFLGYGSKCCCCGESEIDFLCIDHVNNDGKEHRQQMKTPGGVTLYREVVRLGWPDRFQVLCFNCNNARFQRGVCPHQLKS